MVWVSYRAPLYWACGGIGLRCVPRGGHGEEMGWSFADNPPCQSWPKCALALVAFTGYECVLSLYLLFVPLFRPLFLQMGSMEKNATKEFRLTHILSSIYVSCFFRTTVDSISVEGAAHPARNLSQGGYDMSSSFKRRYDWVTGATSCESSHRQEPAAPFFASVFELYLPVFEENRANFLGGRFLM